MDASRTSYRLMFPRGLERAAIAALTRSLSGLSTRRRQGRPTLVLERITTAEYIHHYLWLTPQHAPFVLAQLPSSIPGARVEPAAVPAWTWTKAMAVELCGGRYPLNLEDSAATAATVIGTPATTQLHVGEAVISQWVFVPVPPHRADDKESERKTGRVTFAAIGRLGAHAAHEARAGALIGQMFTVLRGLQRVAGDAPATYFRPRRWPERWVLQELQRREAPSGGIEFPALLSGDELAVVAGVPIGSPPVVGLSLGASRLLPPSIDIPRKGLQLGVPASGAERPLCVQLPDLMRHAVLLGVSGMGKSSLIHNLTVQAAASNAGLALIDPADGKLADDILDSLPAHRAKDVVLIDPVGEDEYPVRLNLLEGAHRDPEGRAGEITRIFDRLYGDNWGPRSADYMRRCVTALGYTPGTTLGDIERLLYDDGYRYKILSRVADPSLIRWWAKHYEPMSPGGREAEIGPMMNKLGPFMSNRRIRTILGPATPNDNGRKRTPGLNPDRLLAEGKIVIIRLPKVYLGDAFLPFGALVIDWLWQAGQRRPLDRRSPFLLFVDEFPQFLNTKNLPEMLEEARKYGVGLILAATTLRELSTAEKQALSNAQTKALFRLDPQTDAPAAARWFGGQVTQHDLSGLGRFELYLEVATADKRPGLASARTLPPPAPTGSAEAARAASRERYGQSAAVASAASRPAAGATDEDLEDAGDGLPALPTAFDLVTDDHELTLDDVLPPDAVPGVEVED